MIYRILPEKDTFVTNFRYRGVPQTGSNLGAAESLQLFKMTPVFSSLSSSLSRILIKFPIEKIQEFVTTQYVSGTISYHLHLFDARHASTLPSSYDISVRPISQEWDEGRGHDVERFRDKGFSNWEKATRNTYWNSPGASSAGPESVVHIDEGHENISVDVTQIVNSWVEGDLTNHGFLISLSGSAETDDQDYYIKMFHSRHSSFDERRPRLEARWNSSRTSGSFTSPETNGHFVVDMPNLRDYYESDEVVRMDVFTRDYDYNPAVVATASSNPLGYHIPNSYYSLSNDYTEQVVVPFGTGSDQSTRLSWDTKGAYFKVHMGSLCKGEVYRVKFLFQIGQESQVIDRGFKFKIY